jgi:Holliday junction resolvase
MARTARGPFAYEISIATHLMQKGWDVDFIDYSGAGRFDLLARQNGVEVEVECKTTSGDTGRKIHRQEANRLADLLLVPVANQIRPYW